MEFRNRMKYINRILAFRNCWTGLGEKGTDLIGGVGYYRIQKPLQFLKKDYSILEFGDFSTVEKKLRSAGKDWHPDDIVPNLIKYSDLVFMKHVSHPGGLAWFAGASEFYNKPLILDMDDDFFSVDSLNPRRDYFNEDALAQIVHKELLRSATALIVATEPLKEVYRKYNKNIHIIHNYNDINDWVSQKAQRPDGRLVIGWAGSQTHEADFEVIKPVMWELWKKYGKKIIFYICGGLPEKYVKEFPKEAVTVLSGTRTMRDYHERLANWGFDIGVAPLVDTAFNDGKGHGKWMEYAMYAIPTVASNVGPYKRIVEDGRTGLLCKTTEDWVGSISRLIENKVECERIGQNAYDEVRKNWQWKDNSWRWKDVFDTYMDKGFKC